MVLFVFCSLLPYVPSKSVGLLLLPTNRRDSTCVALDCPKVEKNAFIEATVVFSPESNLDSRRLFLAFEISIGGPYSAQTYPANSFICALLRRQERKLDE